MHFLNACILKTDEKNALRFKNADFKNQMSDANTGYFVLSFTLPNRLEEFQHVYCSRGIGVVMNPAHSLIFR